jgi:hypothetical protein
MEDGWNWADEELTSSPMGFAWDDDEEEEGWDEDLDWEDEEDDLDEDWEDEEEENDWEEWEEEFEDEEDDSFGRRKPSRPEWN